MADLLTTTDAGAARKTLVQREAEGRRLRARRSALGLTQHALGTRLGVSTNTLARWERGEFPSGIPKVVWLALDALDQEGSTGAS